MSLEESEIFQRVMIDKVDRKRLIFRIVTQAIIMACMVLAVSLFLTALIVTRLHVERVMLMAVICAAITMVCTVIGMILVNLWNQ